MLNRFNVWFLPATSALFFVFVAGPTRVDANPAVQAVADIVSQTHYQTYHLAVENSGLGLYGGSFYNQGSRDRNGGTGLGSLGNQEARLYLQDQFTAMGLGVTTQGTYKNVVGELTGTTTPENVYIIGGHYDTTGTNRPGGDDNASGTAGVLEAARVLSQYQFESTIKFIGFNAEEDGLLGSEDYVASLSPTEKNNIQGMINFDMFLRPGSDEAPGRPIDVELETKGSTAWVNKYIDAVADYVPTLVMGDLWDGWYSGSDNDSFYDGGIPSFLAIENSDGDWYPPNPIANTYYHTAEDASDRLANDPNSPSGVTYDYAFATDVTRAGVALLAQEAVLVGYADFDHDNDVDGTDFLKWQRGELLPPLSSLDLAAWELSYGETFVLPAVASTAIPEPSSLLLTMFAGCVTLLRRGRI